MSNYKSYFSNSTSPKILGLEALEGTFFRKDVPTLERSKSIPQILLKGKIKVRLNYRLF